MALLSKSEVLNLQSETSTNVSESLAEIISELENKFSSIITEAISNRKNCIGVNCRCDSYTLVLTVNQIENYYTYNKSLTISEIIETLSAEFIEIGYEITNVLNPDGSIDFFISWSSMNDDSTSESTTNDSE